MVRDNQNGYAPETHALSLHASPGFQRTVQVTDVADLPPWCLCYLLEYPFFSAFIVAAGVTGVAISSASASSSLSSDRFLFRVGL